MTSVELQQLKTLHLFAGAGGGVLADILLGHRPVCAVEIEEFPRSVLEQRQRDGHLPWFPIWDDINTFAGRQWRGLADVVCGGFPCQDISAAGKGAGLAGDRSGLWFEMLRVIGEVRPRFVFAENSPNLRTRGLGTVVKGLTDLGYDVRWCVLGAWHVGANHKRNRMWLLANAHGLRELQPKGFEQIKRRRPRDCSDESLSAYANGVCIDRCGVRTRQTGRTQSSDCRQDVPDRVGEGLEGHAGHDRSEKGRQEPERSVGETSLFGGPDLVRWWDAEPDVGRVADGVASRVDRIKAIGNGQVPLVAATAWRVLTQDLL